MARQLRKQKLTWETMRYPSCPRKSVPAKAAESRTGKSSSEDDASPKSKVRAREQAAKESKVPERKVRAAQKLEKAAPELAKKVSSVRLRTDSGRENWVACRELCQLLDPFRIAGYAANPCRRLMNAALMN